MKKILCLFLVITFIACRDGESENTDYEGYRYELWKILIDGGYTIDFVGTQVDDQNYENYKGISFDRDHEGIGGIETTGLLQNLPNVLDQIAAPDIVLLGVGGNDMLDGGQPASVPLDNLNKIIDLIQTKFPSAVILVEQIAPANQATMTADLQTTLNEFYTGVFNLANTQSDSISTVIAVDMKTNWQESYFFDGDPVHYSIEGAREVGIRYFNAIKGVKPQPAALKILPLGDSRVEG